MKLVHHTLTTQMILSYVLKFNIPIPDYNVSFFYRNNATDCVELVDNQDVDESNSI